MRLRTTLLFFLILAILSGCAGDEPLSSAGKDHEKREQNLSVKDSGQKMDPSQKGEENSTLPKEEEERAADYRKEAAVYSFKQIEQDGNLLLVNKEYALPQGYVPEDLVVPDIPFSFEEYLPKKLVKKEVAEALEEMFNSAKADGIDLYAVSGYRSYDRQDQIFRYNVNQHGEEYANQFSARPGESEHQTGLSMDVSSSSVNYGLIQQFGETEEGKWVSENASKYGFIIRYPESKQEITGYIYEPWHLRYIGKEAATIIDQKQITLEEYLDEFFLN